MRHPIRSRSLRLAAVAAGLLLAGCTATTPTRFYTLSSLLAAPGEATKAPPHDLAVGVGPVTLPEYLNRPQIVTRAGRNRVVLADFDSWIEPLDGLFTRTLTENLSLLLGTDDVLPLPLRRAIRLDYDVEVNVTRFDVDSSGNAVLDARWLVYRDVGGELVRSARSTIVEPTPTDDEAAADQAPATDRRQDRRSERQGRSSP
jgi:uncharacterized protein